MKLLTVLFFASLFFVHSASAQIQWASRVLSYSSQRDEKAYSAKEALGAPSKLPSYGDCGCSWTPSMPNNNLEEFIRVGFEKKINVRTIIISENFNAGAIKAIYLFDQYNIAHLVYERTKVNAEYGRILTISIPATEFATNDLKLILDTESVQGYNEIDAIGISESDESLDLPGINLTDKIEFRGDAQKLGFGINSPGSEINPLITPDGKTLYYTRKDHPGNVGTIMNDDIWITYRTGNKWSEPINAGLPLNNENNNYVIGISNNGNMLSLANTYNPGGGSEAGVAQSWKKDSTNVWKYPMNLITPGIITYNFFAEYYMNEDRSVLLVSLEKGDSYGLKDIYACFSENQLMWTPPVNLGAVINTVSNEMAPFLAPDNKTLFFSSDGMPGYGDQDIYVSYRLDDTWKNWSTPENLGPRVNSDGFDAYFTYSDSSAYAYFTSTRDEYFNPDIYQIPIKDIPRIQEDTTTEERVITVIQDTENDSLVIPEADIELTNDYLLFGTIFDDETELPVDAKLIFELLEYKSETDSVNTLNKNYRKKITGNVAYKVAVLKPGYLFMEDTVRITDFTTQKVKRIDFRIKPIKKGETFILSDVNFDANSARIKSVSFKQLNLLYEQLLTNPDMQVEIGGHTNGLCDDDYCRKLSEDRAIAVMKYLTDKGIGVSRITAVGYGKANPISSNETPEGRKKNQRVEVKIL